MKPSFTKTLRTISKVSLGVLIVLLLGYVGYVAYFSVKNRPYKVRVSNVTDSAFTVSWVTKEPMVGMVYYGEKDNFLPGPLAWLGKKKAFDDRDVSNAQTECVSKFNEQVSKKSEDSTIEVTGFDCDNVKVTKKGAYYTHHVTVPDLDADKEYFFRVGNGLISYNQSNFEDVEFVERELPVSLVFSQKTKSLITDITTPNSAYGTSYNTYYRNDGSMGERKNFDSVIFLRTFKDGNEYPLMSAVTNKEGGWSIDLANIRDEENKPVSMEGALLEFMPQVDNAKPGSTGYALYEETSFPLKLMGNSEDDWGEDKSEEKELGNLLRKLISKTYAAYCYDVNDNCNATTIQGKFCKASEGYYGNQGLCKDLLPSNPAPTPPAPTPPTSTPSPAPQEPADGCYPDDGYVRGGCSNGLNKCYKQYRKRDQNRTLCYNKVVEGPGVTCGNVGCGDQGVTALTTEGAICQNGNGCTCTIAGTPANGYSVSLSGRCTASCDPSWAGCISLQNCYCTNDSCGAAQQKPSCNASEGCYNSQSLCQDQIQPQPTQPPQTTERDCYCTENQCAEPIKKTNCNTREGCYLHKSTCESNLGGAPTKKDCYCTPNCSTKVQKDSCDSASGCYTTTTACNNAKSSSSCKSSSFPVVINGKTSAGGGDLSLCVSASTASNYNAFCSSSMPYTVNAGFSVTGTRLNVSSTNGYTIYCSNTPTPTPTKRTERVNATETGAACTDKDNGCICVYSDGTTKDFGKKNTSEPTLCKTTDASPTERMPVIPTTTGATCPDKDNGCICKYSDGTTKNFGKMNTSEPTLCKTIDTSPTDTTKRLTIKANAEGAPCHDQKGYGYHYGCICEGSGKDPFNFGKAGEPTVCQIEGGGVDGKYCFEIVRNEAQASALCSESQYPKSKGCLPSSNLYSTLTECRNFLKRRSEVKCYYINIGDYGLCSNSGDWSFCYNDDGTIRADRYLELGSCNAAARSMIGQSDRIIGGGSKCYSPAGCYCYYTPESMGATQISNQQCCGSTYGYTTDRNGIPKSQCTGNRGSFCSMTECEKARSTIITTELCHGDSSCEDLDSYNESTQLVCFKNPRSTLSSYHKCEWREYHKFDDTKDNILCPLEDCPALSSGGASSKYVSKVHAEEVSSSTDLIYFPEISIYKISAEGGGSAIVMGSPGTAHLFYYERNGLDGYQAPEDPNNPQDNEDLLVPKSATTVTVSDEVTMNEIDLKSGINIISFNFLPTVSANQGLKMGDFVKLMNKDEGIITRIASFQSGAWEGGVSYDFTTKETKGFTDETLVFGKGYVIIATKDATISVPGKTLKSSVPIAFSEGWNLVGVHGHTKAYTAQSFINSINSTEGLQSNNVTWWPTSKGRYEGFQVSEGQTYGQDFPISPLNGYFVRINSFQPKEANCKSIIWNPGGQKNGECGTK